MMAIEDGPEHAAPRLAHFAIVLSDADQPYHVRIVGGNGETILSGENLASEADAMVAVCAVAGMFGEDPYIVRSHDGSQGHVLAGRLAPEVVWLDERTIGEVPC